MGVLEQALPREQTVPVLSGNDPGIGDDPDLAFFRALIAPVEQRTRYWQGRSDRIAKMALFINREAGCPVDECQLAVAVYTHDFGMASMPMALLHKTDTLSDREILLLRSHVQASAQLLEHMPRWRPAREMVLQHHEHADGSGYPYGLREREISDGAKIIAIADTFDAITHQRAYDPGQKQPILRAMTEINAAAGRQLSAYWVEVFNRVVEPVLAARR